MNLRLPALPLLALLLASAPLEAQTLTEVQVEAVRRGAEAVRLPAGGVRVPIVGPGDLPLVEATLNGRGPYRLLVDLGSNVVVFRRGVVDAAGGAVLVDRPRGDLVQLDSLRIGDALYGPVTAAAYDELDVDGVIGYNMLRLSSFTLDFPGRTLALHEDSLPPPDGERILGYVVQGRMPYLPVAIADTTLLFNFDTGATNWIVMPPAMVDAFDWATPWRPGPTLYNEQIGAVRVEIAQLDADVRFGRYRVRRPVVFLDPEVEDAWFGAGLLADYALEFDTVHDRLRITGPAVASAPRYCTAGFSLRPEGDAALVGDVIPRTSADGRLVEGDRILEVEGRPAGELDSRALRAMACASDRLTVVRERDGAETLSIPTARIP